MKSYPTISRKIIYGNNFYCFDKLDGSNIRAEWSKKRSFYKFGTRTRLLDKNEPILGESISLIKNQYEKDLHDIFLKERQENVVCFFEFYGVNSFAGMHIKEDHFISLIDVSFYKRGIIDPREFINLFKNLSIPKLLYKGSINQSFIDSVKKSTLENMTFEGVVCKEISSKNKISNMFKIKSQLWLDRLKDYCKENKKLYEELL